MLGASEVSIDRVARNLGMSRGTLYRRLKAEGIESARENIARLRQMSAQLSEKVEGLPEKDQTPVLEA